MSIRHIPFYPSDWLAGTRGLSAEETGVYITLICRMYEMAGPIERDDARLARLCGCKTKPGFVRCLDFLITEGKITQDESGLFNDRAAIEIEKVVKISQAARQAAESRWRKKYNKINSRKDAIASEPHMRNGCQLEPEPERDTLEANASNGASAVDATSEAIWKRGVPFLVEQGTPERQARSLIGKWLRDAGAPALFDAMAAAKKSGTGDPVPYITEALKAPPDVRAMVQDAVKRFVK